MPSAEEGRGGDVFSHVLEQVREELNGAEVTALDTAKA
jgi:hypothetical protein